MNRTLHHCLSVALALLLVFTMSCLPALAYGTETKLPTRVNDEESLLDYGSYSYDWKNKTLNLNLHGDNTVDYNEPFRVNSNRNYKNILTLDTDDSTVFGLNDIVLSGDINHIVIRQRATNRSYATDRGIKKWITMIAEANKDLQFTVNNGRLAKVVENYREDAFYYMDEDLGRLSDQQSMTMKTTSNYVYDAKGQLTEIHRNLLSRDQDDSETQDMYFTYDKDGNLNGAKVKASQKENQGMTRTDPASSFVNHRIHISNIKDYTYEYDAAGQLTRATMRDSRSTEPEHSYKTYTYNSDGTIKQVYFEDKKKTKEPESSDIFERIKARLTDPDERTKTFTYEYATKGDLQK